MRFLVLLLCLLHHVQCQDMCEDDAGCPGDDNCCSDFGFCGKGEGFCTPSTRRDSGTASRARPATRSRSGAGCVLDDVEFVGGDLPAIVGGGGIKLDRNTATECFNRCDENPGCTWYTYDTKKYLCYLKDRRGYMRNRTDGFISGATFRDGCNECAHFPARTACPCHAPDQKFTFLHLVGVGGGGGVGEAQGSGQGPDHYTERPCWQGDTRIILFCICNSECLTTICND